MHPFAAEQLARERWDAMVVLAQAQPARSRRWRARLRQLYVRRAGNYPADRGEAVDLVAGHRREQPA
jgi:hypothetical protein